jgi:dynein heavy chain
MSKIKTTWESKEFTIIPFKEGETAILGGSDELKSQLEDDQVTIATMSASRYAGVVQTVSSKLIHYLTLQQMLTEWHTKLSTIYWSLESWINVQRNWMYLQSIFNAADIQRQLPTEAKLFHQVDKSYTSIKLIYLY